MNKTEAMKRLDAIEAEAKALRKLISDSNKKEDDFVPGWYMYWDNGMKERRINRIENKQTLVNTKFAWDHIEPVTQELLNQFLFKTRYDWKAILEKYPSAKYATTDENGRVDVWETRPCTTLRAWVGRDSSPITQGTAGWTRIGDTSDWKSSLEEKPFDI